MIWFGWLLVGAVLGVALAALLVACVGREPSGRGGTLTFDSPDARAVFKHRREASARRWSHRDLIAGRCSTEDYVAGIKAEVDRELMQRRS